MNNTITFGVNKMYCENPLQQKSGTKNSKKFAKVKSKRILNIISMYCDIKNATILDAGCGHGYNTFEYAKQAREVVGIDLNKKAILKCKKIKQERRHKNISFKFGNVEQLPFETKSFDIVISQHVLEHVTDQKKYVSEMYRVLKNNGVIYLAVPNKLYPIEPHFKVPFMQLMPKSIADIIARKRGDKEFSIQSPTFWTVKKMLSKAGFQTIDYTIKILNNPQKFHIEEDIGKNAVILANILKPFNFVLKYFSPTIVLIGLRRRTASKEF